MPNVPESSNPAKKSNGATLTSILQEFTKDQLIDILTRDIQQPMEDIDVYRCAMSAVWRWCDALVEDRFYTAKEVVKQLEAIERIYRHE